MSVANRGMLSKKRILLLSVSTVVVVIATVLTYIVVTRDFGRDVSITATSSPLALRSYKLNGITLSIPATWKNSGDASEPYTNGSQSSENQTPESKNGNATWQLAMTDSSGDGTAVLLVSVPLSAGSPDQASEAASALLKSSFSEYEAIGAFSFPSASSNSAVNPNATATDSENAEDARSYVLRTTFNFKSDAVIEQGMCWIVPTAEGYVLVVLLKNDDFVVQQLETSILESSQ